MPKGTLSEATGPLWLRAKGSPRHFYSVPWRLVGPQLDVRIGERLITVYHAVQLVKTQVRVRGELRSIDPDDFPAQEIALLLRTLQ